MTTAPCKALFKGLIDYAGLYPPAKLSLSDALANYRQYLRLPDSWVLSRFIAGSAHIAQITDDMRGQFSNIEPLAISLVVKDVPRELPQVIASLQEPLRLEAVEVLLVPGIPVAEQLVAHRNTLRLLSDAGHRLDVFYEVPFSEKWEDEFQELVECIASKSAVFGQVIGCKLRCGGLEPHLIPAPERLAKALCACAASAVPVKFTAGLHQPFRHTPQVGETGSIGLPMHGFFNLYFAAIVANTTPSDTAKIAAIIAEMDSCAPRMELDQIAWLGQRITGKQIQEMRSARVFSFGSCDFKEPIAAARSLGWL